MHEEYSYRGRFIISISINSSCLAKERCIPVTANLKLRHMRSENWLQAKCMFILPPVYTAATLKPPFFQLILSTLWQIFHLKKISVWECSVINTKPESHTLFGAIQNHLLVSSCLPISSISIHITRPMLIKFGFANLYKIFLKIFSFSSRFYFHFKGHVYIYLWVFDKF
jgi:hypothetical protein